MSESWLAIETSGRTGFVALSGESIYVHELSESRRHARDLTAKISEVCSDAGVAVRELTGVIVSQGPGSYTGLRVGITAAKLLAYATGCRFVAVPTFHVIAAQAIGEGGSIDVIADAQQRRVYHQRFRRASDQVVPASDLSIRPLEELIRDRQVESFTGPALDVYGEEVATAAPLADEAPWHPSPAYLLEVGVRISKSEPEVDWWATEPLYLRGSYAEEQAKVPRTG